MTDIPPASPPDDTPPPPTPEEAQATAMLTAAPADPAAAAKKMWTCLILTGAGSAFCFSAALAYPQRPFLSQTTTPNSAWLVVGIILGLINMAITIDLGHRLLERFLRTADR